MLNETLKKLDYPNTVIKEYKNWILLCMPQQVTLGSLVLLCRDDMANFSQISSDSFNELRIVIKEIENNLKQLFDYDKINYLMLMMNDPVVHFDVLPRYATKKEYGGFSFEDYSWPKVSDLSKANEIDKSVLQKIILDLKSSFAD